MSINLVKGQKINLQKSDGSSLHKVIVGLGWDAAKANSRPIDCDASAFVCTDGKIKATGDMVYYGHLKHSSGAIIHKGDNLTGKGDEDDEQIVVNLSDIPSTYDKVVFVVNIYQAKSRGQDFSGIDNAFIRIVDAETNQEFCKYNLSEKYNGMTAMIFGELYRRNGSWKFTAIGQGTQDNSVTDLAHRYR